MCSLPLFFFSFRPNHLLLPSTFSHTDASVDTGNSSNARPLPRMTNNNTCNNFYPELVPELANMQALVRWAWATNRRLDVARWCLRSRRRRCCSLGGSHSRLGAYLRLGGGCISGWPSWSERIWRMICGTWRQSSTTRSGTASCSGRG